MPKFFYSHAFATEKMQNETCDNVGLKAMRDPDRRSSSVGNILKQSAPWTVKS